MKRILVIIICISVALITNAQISMNTILENVTKNNLQIKASSENLAAASTLTRTGLNPDDPQVEFGYFPGNKSDIGTKSTLSISQSFYFPSFYMYSYQTAKLSADRLVQMHRLTIKQVQMEAATFYIELIYLDKYCKELNKRTFDAEKVKIAIEKKFQSGDANQLEMNKATIEFMRWSNELAVFQARKEEKIKQLIALNGGNSLSFENPEYPIWETPALDSIISIAMSNDPTTKALSFDQQLANTNLKMNQSMWFPKFKIGYGQETILDESYRGVQAGISIPLWQNKNVVKYSHLKQQSAESTLMSYNQQMQSAIQSKHQLIISLKMNFEAYKKMVDSNENQDLLLKSLNSGNISVLDYYRELSAWYEISDFYLKATKDYYSEMIFLEQFKW